MELSTFIVLLVTFGFVSFSVHKKKFFPTWSREARNGFHTGILFAAIAVSAEYLLSLM